MARPKAILQNSEEHKALYCITLPAAITSGVFSNPNNVHDNSYHKLNP